jgi:hypothetical protein
LKTNGSTKQQKVYFLNSIVAGHVNLASMLHRPYTHHVGNEASRNGTRYNDTGEVVPPEIIMRDIQSGVRFKVKIVSYSNEDE